jgi:hypothetical protein
MKMRKVKTKAWPLCIAVFMLGLISCTHVYEAPEVPVAGYPQMDKIGLNVGLRLSDALRNANWEKSRMGDTFRIPLGDVLSRNAEALTRELFTNVVILDNATLPTGIPVDAILIPNIIVAERTTGATAFGMSIFTVILEWKLEDREGHTLWVDTVKGEGHTRTGNMFTHKSNAEKQIRMTIDDLFQRSFQAISSSPEIRVLAVNKS